MLLKLFTICFAIQAQATNYYGYYDRNYHIIHFNERDLADSEGVDAPR